jgi:hypothetical protein
MINNNQKLFDSSCIIITHAKGNYKNKFIDILKNIATQNKQCEPVRDILINFSNSPAKICLFEKPKTPGLYNLCSKKSIEFCINQSQYINTTIKPIISVKYQVYIRNLIENIKVEIFQALKNFIEALSEKYNRAYYIFTLKTYYKDLNDFCSTKYYKTLDFCEKISELEKKLYRSKLSTLKNSLEKLEFYKECAGLCNVAENIAEWINMFLGTKKVLLDKIKKKEKQIRRKRAEVEEENRRIEAEKARKEVEEVERQRRYQKEQARIQAQNQKRIFEAQQAEIARLQHMASIQRQVVYEHHYSSGGGIDCII